MTYCVYDVDRNYERRLLGVYRTLDAASRACRRAVWAAVIERRPA